jgi:hypothetical protein
VLNEIYLNRLKDISLALYDPNHPVNFHVSFIVSKGKILSIGLNNTRTHPTNLLNKKIGRDGNNISASKGICSEFSALKKVKNTMNIPFHKTTMVNIRIKRNKQFGLSKPCQSCQSLLKFFGLADVIWTDDSGSFVSQK